MARQWASWTPRPAPWQSPAFPSNDGASPLHRRRGAHRRGEDRAGTAPGGADGRPPPLGAGGGEPLPPELLPGQEETRLPDPALLPALPLPAAAGAVPAGSLQPGHRRRLLLRQGPDLRLAGAGPRRARALRAGLPAARAAGGEARPGGLPPGARRGAPLPHPQ